MLLRYSSSASSLLLCNRKCDHNLRSTQEDLLNHTTSSCVLSLITVFPVCLLLFAVCATLESQLQRPVTADDLPAAQQQLQQLAGSSPQLTSAQQLLAAHLTDAAEFAPVCAVLGGIIANNVVAAVSGSGAPLHNLLYYSLFDGRAIVERQPAGSAQQSSKAAAAAAAGPQQKAEEVVID